ncbi:MAG: competence/damage-inducible protein A [Bacteroidetes bacterium]|nr:competence/damage-inducible protein A [Bacteroidota bacterium]
MLADIITIGDEILIGQVIDTNSAWIAEQLSLSGIKVRQMLSVSDQRETILNALKEAHVFADLIIITGGLGPTKDDKTKPALCDFFQTKLVLNQASFDNTSRIFAERNLEMTVENKKQAMLPESCIPLVNKIGTAWGMWLEKGKTVTVSLPGVPYEMKYLMEHEVMPRLKKQFILPFIVHKTILTQGIGESWLADKIAAWEDALPNYISLAYLPSPGMVRLRLSATGPNKDVLEFDMEQQVEKLRQIIPDFICGYGKQTLPEIVGKLLCAKQQSLSTAESCTGGYISQLLTSISGSSGYFMGAIISYADYVKQNELGVIEEDLLSKGAVSQEVAEQMALGAMKKFKTDYSIATTGIAGPTGARPDKPVGTVWIAIGTPKGIISKKFLFGDNRERNILRTGLTALNMLRKALDK